MIENITSRKLRIRRILTEVLIREHDKFLPIRDLIFRYRQLYHVLHIFSETLSHLALTFSQGGTTFKVVSKMSVNIDFSNHCTVNVFRYKRVRQILTKSTGSTKIIKVHFYFARNSK